MNGNDPMPARPGSGLGGDRAVLFNMAATPQYFSSDSRTASSMALCDTGPDTV